MRRVIVALFALSCGPALAQTSAQVKTLENVAMAIAVEKDCPSVQLDPRILAATLLVNGLRAADIMNGGRYQALVVARAAEAGRTFSAHGTSLVCGVGKSMFGPRGINAPGLLVER